MPIILLIAAAIALVAYIAIIVAIWQRGTDSLPRRIAARQLTAPI